MDISSVMVTGSHGFIGRRLIEKLKEHGVNVIEFDIKNGRDILNIDSFSDLNGVDIVVHLAAKLFVPDSFANPADMYKSNINGAINILEFCRKKDVKRIVYASSYVYGIPDYLPIDERHKTNPHNPYGMSKLIGEMLSIGYFNDYGIVPVTFRPFNIFGPGQAENFLIPSIMKQILNADKIVVNDLSPKRDFIYIDDVIDAYICSIFYYKNDKPAVFNIGYGKSYSVVEIIRKIQKIAGTNKAVVEEGVKRKNEILDCVADITKIKEQFNWMPKYSFEKGLKQTFLSYKNDV